MEWLEKIAKGNAVKDIDLEKDSPAPPAETRDAPITVTLPEGYSSSTVEIRAQNGSLVGTCTIAEPAASICLADHLKIHGQKYLIDLLADVKYVYGDAVLKLCGNNLRLDVDEVTKNLRKHMIVLREQLINEVESWFSGSGRLLETGPDIVECYLSRAKGDGLWQNAIR
jgi:hypothetical protein